MPPQYSCPSPANGRERWLSGYGHTFEKQSKGFQKTFNVKNFANLSSNSTCLHCCEVFKMLYIYWIRKMPWRRAWQPTPVFLPGESPRMEEPGGLQSLGSQRVGHDWVTKHSTHTHTHTHTRLDYIYIPSFFFKENHLFPMLFHLPEISFPLPFPGALYVSPVLFSPSLLIPFTVTT